MTDFSSAESGGHALPLHIVSIPPSTRAPKRPRTGLILGLLGTLIVAAAIVTVQVTANLGFDDAEADLHAAVRSATRTASTVGESNASLKSTATSAGQILESDSGTLADAASKEKLAAAVTEATHIADETDTILDLELPAAGEKPTWFWELFAASAHLAEQHEAAVKIDTDLQAESPLLTDARTSVTDSGVAFLNAAATAAAGFEAAHVSAKNDDVIALRDAAARMSATVDIDDNAVESFSALESAAAKVVTSEQVELGEKSGPLQSVRLEIEAFARSLAPGVLMEFDWSPLVNNAGNNGSMGGLTTWWWDEPDRATIQLSNSVAEQWPSIRSKSLVAHEVGHAISVKCEDLYDSSNQDSIEMWATAWAISMGYTDDANGVWAYGYPPQSYIDAASGCR